MYHVLSFAAGAITVLMFSMAYVIHLNNQFVVHLHEAMEHGRKQGFDNGYTARAKVATEKLRP